MSQFEITALVRAALVSFQVRDGDVAANLRVVETVLDAHAGIDLFVFPELSLCGMPLRCSIETVSRIAEEVPDGPSIQHLIALAQHYQTVLCAGIIEVEDHTYFITHFLCGPNGYIEKQRKLYPLGEISKKGIISGGRNVCCMELFGMRCVIMACADWMFPEGPYIASLHEVALLIAPTDAYTLSNIDLLRQIGVVRVSDCGASLLVAFGSNSPGSEEQPTGLVVNMDGTSLLETHTVETVNVMPVDIVLQPPQHRWSRPLDRMSVISAALDQYHVNL